MNTADTTLATGATPPPHQTLQRTTMTTPRRPGTRSLLAALLATLLSTIVLPALASAATAPIPRAAPPGVYLARLPERDAYLAVLVDHHSAAAYLCDDGTVAKWFPHRRITLGAISLRARDHRARLTARTTRTDGLTGRVRLHGHRYAFTARRAHGPAGLYRAAARTSDGVFEAGWIIQNDGSQRGAVNFIDNNVGLAVPSPAPRLDPAATLVTAGSPLGVVTVHKLHLPGFINNNVDL